MTAAEMDVYGERREDRCDLLPVQRLAIIFPLPLKSD